MKRKYKIILIILLPILLILLIFGTIKLYNYIRIKNAKIEVVLKEDMTAEFNSNVKVSDYIESINGKIIDNYKIDTTKLGVQNIEFKFINDDNIKVSYSYEINIVDTIKPVVWLGSTYSVRKNSDINLTEAILCGDNYDKSPNCYIDGYYDLNTVGNYPLVFKAEDSSGNIEEVKFNLSVYEPSSSNSSQKSNDTSYTDFSEVIKNYKTDNNKIGLDISEWQGNINFDKLKDAGVEFIMIRVGGTRGKDGDYFLDDKFKQNISSANKVGIPVGVYFYSYANSSKKAIKDANWVLDQIKDYNVDLPVAFDWEEWGSFNKYHLSFFNLTTMAEDFLNFFEKRGYSGMLYSSKAYLENIWLETDYDIWLAHYTKQTDYDKDYKMWQLCSNGKIDGIDGYVDIDILYN